MKKIALIIPHDEIRDAQTDFIREYTVCLGGL